MDRATQFTPQAILASMQEFYENVLNNPQLRDLKMQLTTAMITGSLVATPSMASAADVLPSGEVTYTKFMDAISAHDIERVRIAADGRTAEFLNTEGGRGAVNLFNDPSLFKTLLDN